jgi:signal transduction histidine kinase/CheY-like chemotaxis protein
MDDFTGVESASDILHTRTRQLETIRTITAEMTRELDLTRLLTLIQDRATDLVGVQTGAVHLWDPEGQVLVTRAYRGYPPWRGDVRLRLGEGVVGMVAQSRKGMVINEYRSSRYAAPIFLEQATTTAIACEPLLYRDSLLGVIAVTNDGTDRRFSEADSELLRLFADHAAIAVKNAQLFTELSQSYQELRQAQDELVRSEKLRALGQLAAGIAHDLNNMLAIILGQTEFLRLTIVETKAKAALAPLATAAADAAQMVRRLQEFSRPQSTRALAPVQLAAVAAEALEITRSRWRDEPLRQGRTIQVRVELPVLPRVLGHAPEIREVLTNLILNAVDAMPEGGTLALSGTSQDGWVELHVRDTGLGMSKAVQQRIFEPFFTTKGAKGTGLGLAVSYGIMERHGGRIQVQSDPGRGTTFTLAFHAAPSESGGDPGLAKARPNPCRILVIDDDQAVRESTATLLRVSGHFVMEAESGPVGLGLMAGQPFDVLITDLGMPEMTGWEVARAAKNLNPMLPVILVTGWGSEVSRDVPDSHIVDRVMGKPVRLDDLLEAIAESRVTMAMSATLLPLHGHA